MSLNVTQKLIRSHLLHGDITPGEEVPPCQATCRFTRRSKGGV